MKTIAVSGPGALARIFCREVQNLLSEDYRIIAVMARNKDHAEALADQCSAFACTDINDLLAGFPDIVVEFAGRDAVKTYAQSVLAHGSDLVIASIGALADDQFRKSLFDFAREHGRKVYIPNGAIGALDLMQTFALMGEAEVTIGNTKAPRSLEGAPYLNGKTLPTERKEVIFTGSVPDAINAFPKNVNVAVAAALASDTLGSATVKITSDPQSEENIHHIVLKNKIMRAELTVAGKPDPANPKSSTSTAWSVVALLKNLASPVQFF